MVEPQIYLDQNFHSNSPVRFWQTKKLLYVVGVLVLAEMIWAGYTLTRPVTQNEISKSLSTNPVVSSGPEASLDIVGPTNVKVGNTSKVDISLSSTGEVDSVDLIIKYDPSFIEPIDGITPVALGSLFTNYPVNKIEQPGLISVSGTGQPGASGFKGQGIFGGIIFRAKKVGQTAITLDFSKGQTTDSNVIETKIGRDILSKVTDFSLNISQ